MANKQEKFNKMRRLGVAVFFCFLFLYGAFPAEEALACPPEYESCTTDDKDGSTSCSCTCGPNMSVQCPAPPAPPPPPPVGCGSGSTMIAGECSASHGGVGHNQVSTLSCSGSFGTCTATVSCNNGSRTYSNQFCPPPASCSSGSQNIGGECTASWAGAGHDTNSSISCNGTWGSCTATLNCYDGSTTVSGENCPGPPTCNNGTISLGNRCNVTYTTIPDGATQTLTCNGTYGACTADVQCSGGVHTVLSASCENPLAYEGNTTTNDIKIERREMVIDTLKQVEGKLKVVLDEVKACQEVGRFYDVSVMGSGLGACIDEVDSNTQDHGKTDFPAPPGMPACDVTETLYWDGDSWECAVDQTN